MHCVLKKDNEECYNLICLHNQIELDFSSAVFGIMESEVAPFSTESDSLPVFHDPDGRWKSTCILGECNMNVQTVRYQEHTYLSFAFEIKKEFTKSMYYFS